MTRMRRRNALSPTSNEAILIHAFAASHNRVEGLQGGGVGAERGAHDDSGQGRSRDLSETESASEREEQQSPRSSPSEAQTYAAPSA